MRPRLIALFLGVALGLAACSTPPSAAEAYKLHANDQLQRYDVITRLNLRLAARHPEVDRVVQAAFQANKRIEVGWFSAVTNPPPVPAKPGLSRIIVAMMVDERGRMIDLECATSSGDPLDEGRTARVREAVATWEGTPATADGQPIAGFSVFDAHVSDRDFYVAEPRRLD